MNQDAEIQMLKDRVATLEKILLKRISFRKATGGPRGKSDEICEAAKRFATHYFCLKAGDIIGKCRSERIVWPRWIGIHLAHKYSGARPTDIARIFNRDHASIPNALEGIHDRMQIDPRRREQVLELEKEFETLLNQSTSNNQLSTAHGTSH